MISGSLASAAPATQPAVQLTPSVRLPIPSLSAAALRAALRSWLPARPGAGQRRRSIAAAALAPLVLLLRPWPPFQWLPGWCVGVLLLWAVAEALLWQWRPRRWR